METSRLSYTPVTDYLNMTLRDFLLMRQALENVLEREKARIQAADLLYSSWLAFPKMDFPHPELLNSFANPGTGVPWVRVDYTPLFEQLVKEIRNCRKPLTKSSIRKVPVRSIGIDSVPPGSVII